MHAMADGGMLDVGIETVEVDRDCRLLHGREGPLIDLPVSMSGVAPAV
jgi:hypothetical protein